MFDSDFLTSDPRSQEAYQQLISLVARIVCESWPSRPYSGKNPSQLESLIAPELLPASDLPPEALLHNLRTLIANSIAISHPHAAAHLHCPPLLSALAAEVVVNALNQSMDSFDQAPMATIVEQKLIRWLSAEAGFPATSGGTFTTGGSQSNYMGLLLARDACLHKHWNWNTHTSGLPPEATRLRILCSDVAHFTVEKSAAQLGLGTDSVVRISVDDNFCMRPDALQTALRSLREANLLPMAIVGTAGTTDFGSIDPLPKLAALAHAANCWFHVDAAYGGAFLFSPQHRPKIAGIETADSLSIDFHKLFWQPIPASVFLLQNASLFDLLKMHADYLNSEEDEQAGIPNLVSTSLLTSRRFDALKLWISFQALGRSRLAAMIDRIIALAAYSAEAIRQSRSLELLAKPALSSVVFRYVPASGDAESINANIPRQLFTRGLAVIGHTRVRRQQCLKFTCMNPTASESDIQNLVGLVVDQGQRLEQGATD